MSIPEDTFRVGQRVTVQCRPGTVQRVLRDGEVSVTMDDNGTIGTYLTSSVKATQATKGDATPSGFAEAVVGKHHRRCENVENDTCGTECYMIMLGNKILATTPGVGSLDEMVARFIVTSFNAERSAAKIAEGHYEHE